MQRNPFGHKGPVQTQGLGGRPRPARRLACPRVVGNPCMHRCAAEKDVLVSCHATRAAKTRHSHGSGAPPPGSSPARSPPPAPPGSSPACSPTPRAHLRRRHKVADGHRDFLHQVLAHRVHVVLELRGDGHHGGPLRNSALQWGEDRRPVWRGGNVRAGQWHQQAAPRRGQTLANGTAASHTGRRQKGRSSKSRQPEEKVQRV